MDTVCEAITTATRNRCVRSTIAASSHSRTKSFTGRPLLEKNRFVLGEKKKFNQFRNIVPIRYRLPHKRLSVDKHPTIDQRLSAHVFLKQAPLVQQARGGRALQERQKAHRATHRCMASLLINVHLFINVPMYERIHTHKRLSIDRRLS